MTDDDQSPPRAPNPALGGIARRVREARERRHLTQPGLGSIVGRSKQLISAWEGGVAEMTATTAVAVAAALGVSTDWLLSGREGVAGPRVPLLKSDQVIDYYNKNIDLSALPFVFTPQPMAARAFAILVADTSMAEVGIPKGGTIFIDPDGQIEPGCIVLATVSRTAHESFDPPIAIARFLHQRSPHPRIAPFELAPAAPAWPIISIAKADDGQIVGRVIAAFHAI